MASDLLLTDVWRQKLATYSTVFVGFSGGLDSTVLLHSLAGESSLTGKLQAVHVHHGLSKNASDWQIHCEQYCEALGIPFIVRQVNITSRTNLEEQARDARYQVFTSLLAANDALVLAHHSDDQAETLLLQLFRGAGIDGLSAMLDATPLTKGELLRPFLQFTRKTLEAYAARHNLIWINDESNQNIAFSRNFLRQNIIPLLQEKWPGVITNVTRTAMHCQQAKRNLEALAKMDCRQLSDAPNPTLAIAPLRSLSHDRLINVLRLWMQNNDVRSPSDKILNQLIDEVILVRPDATPIVQWGDTVLRRYQQTLYLLKNEPSFEAHLIDWSAFPEPLPLGSKSKDETYLYAHSAEQGLYVPTYKRLQVRFRQGGELFSWRGQTKQLKKLLQEWRIPPWQRDKIPLLYIENDLAAVVGYAISDDFFRSESDSTYQIVYGNLNT